LQKDITLLSVLQERKIQAGVEFAYVSEAYLKEPVKAVFVNLPGLGSRKLYFSACVKFDAESVQ
jgi:hypothetical protein